MASRHQDIVSRKQRGAVAPVVKGKNAAVACGKNREALGDIGNLVKDGGFAAKLLANEQAAVAANKKKLVAIKPTETVQRGGKKLARKVIIKPKVEKNENKVIVRSSGKKAKLKLEADSSQKYSRKKVATLTSVLTARSKVACGLTEKPKESVNNNIDAADKEDQLAVVDYVEDIYKFYKSAENSSRIHFYMDSQVEINAKMRTILAGWLIEVHHYYKLMPETLYLTFYVVDRYLSMEIVLRRELQLVGVSAMLIASKYEEIWGPKVDELIKISCRAYTREQILGMEKSILNKLEWNLTVPTPFVFLVRFVKASGCNKKEGHMVFFFAELGLTHYSMLKYYPSTVAAAAVYATRCTLKKSPLWTETLECHTGFSEQELLDCAEILMNAHVAASEGDLKIIYKKYSGEKFAGVALHPPIRKSLEESKAPNKSSIEPKKLVQDPNV